MKKLIRLGAFLLVVGAFSLTSCGDDKTCYTCSEIAGTVEAFTICDDEAGSSIAISAHEALGGTCTEN